MPRLLATSVICLVLSGPVRAQPPAPVPEAAWEAAGFGSARVTDLGAGSLYAAYDPASFKAELPLQLVMFRGSGWDAAKAKDMLGQIVRVYAPAGLRISKATLVETDPPDGRSTFVKFDRNAEGSVLWLARKNPLKARPVIYLFKGFDDADDTAAFSSADWGDGGEPLEMRDSVFLPIGITSQAYLDERKDSPYSTAAHELLHVLTREGQHYNDPEPNLLNIWRRRSDRILDRDVARLLACPLLTPIARPARLAASREAVPRAAAFPGGWD